MALLFAQIAPVVRRLQTFGALRHRNYRWYWYGSIGQSAALGMQFLILGWLVLELTDSSSQLGLVIFLYGVPNLALLVFGGIFADRIDRRWLLIISQTAVAALTMALAALTIAQLVSLEHIYAAAFILGTVQGLNMPARMAIVADLVDRNDLMNAISLNAAVMNSGRIVGPAVAGGVIEIAGIGNALILNAGCYAVGVMCLLVISGVSSISAARKTAIVGGLVEGLRYFWTTPVTFTIIGIGFAFGFFAAAYIQVLPAFAKEVLGVGAGGAGLLISAGGLGSLAGSLLLASAGNVGHKNWLLLGAALSFGVSLFLFAWSPWFSVSWVILLFVGMGFMGYVSMGTIVLQLTVPPELHGRVLSLWLVGAALHYIGALPMAVVADLFGWPIAVAGGAAAFLSVVMWLGIWRPTLRHLRV